jgi:uncharacterized OB-fold protein
VDENSLSIEEFYNRCSQGSLYITRCKDCAKTYGSPRKVCPKCGSQNMICSPSEGKGELLTWTVIHVTTPMFQEQIPYIVGIVKLKEGGKLLTLIKNIEPEILKQGLKLKINFETEKRQNEWPNWSKYFFEPY